MMTLLGISVIGAMVMFLMVLGYRSYERSFGLQPHERTRINPELPEIFWERRNGKWLAYRRSPKDDC